MELEKGAKACSEEDEGLLRSSGVSVSKDKPRDHNEPPRQTNVYCDAQKALLDFENTSLVPDSSVEPEAHRPLPKNPVQNRQARKPALRSSREPPQNAFGTDWLLKLSLKERLISTIINKEMGTGSAAVIIEKYIRTSHDSQKILLREPICAAPTVR